MNNATLTVLRAIDPDYDEKYGSGGSGNLTLNNNLIGPPSRNTGPTSSTDTVEVVVRSGEEKDNGFNCPIPGQNDCLERIPREDVTQVLSLEIDGSQVSSNLSVNMGDVRQMNLCTIDGFIFLQFGEGVPDSQIDVARQMIAFDGTWSLIFRDQPVPGYKNRPLSEFLPKAGCCDLLRVCVDCRIPDYGALRIETNLEDVFYKSQMLEEAQLKLRMGFSGCGCNCGTDCGCS